MFILGVCVYVREYMCIYVCVALYGHAGICTIIHTCRFYCILWLAFQVRTEIQRNYEDWKLFNALRITAEFLGKLNSILHYVV